MQGKSNQTDKIQEELDISGVVGLDLSLTGTGVVRFSNNPAEDKVIMTIGTDSKFGPIEERLKFSIKKIIELISPFDIVFIEDYAYSISPRKSSLTTLAELGGIIKYICWRKTGLWPIAVASTSIKKWLSGKGNLKQENFLLEGYKKYKREFRTKDEVVAYTLADFGHCLIGQPLIHPLMKQLLKREEEQLELFRKKHPELISKLQALARKRKNFLT